MRSASLEDRVAEELRLRRPAVRDPHRDYDFLGRKQPTRVDAVMLLRAIPGLAGRFRVRVPHAMFVQVDERHCDVACPCGETHRIELLTIGGGGCGRSFIWDGIEVYVAGSPATERPSAVDPEPVLYE